MLFRVQTGLEPTEVITALDEIHRGWISLCSNCSFLISGTFDLSIPFIFEATYKHDTLRRTK